MHGKLTVIGEELAAEKAAINRRGFRGGGPSHPLNKVRLYKSRLLGSLEGT